MEKSILEAIWFGTKLAAARNQTIRNSHLHSNTGWKQQHSRPRLPLPHFERRLYENIRDDVRNKPREFGQPRQLPKNINDENRDKELLQDRKEVYKRKDCAWVKACRLDIGCN